MHQDITEIFVERWPKHCNKCGADHDEATWEKLRYVGVQFSGMVDYPDLELRNCECGSTISIIVSQDFA